MGRTSRACRSRTRLTFRAAAVRFQPTEPAWCSSEGAVFLLIESRAHAEKRGAAAYCRLSGYGIASDGYHIGTPNSRGPGCSVARSTGRRKAASRADQLLQRPRYRDARWRSGREQQQSARSSRDATEQLPVSSTKGDPRPPARRRKRHRTGRLRAGDRGSFLPATAHLDEVDPECPLRHVANRPLRDTLVEHALSLSAGFGGTNVALAVSKEHDLRTKSCAGEESTI